MHRSILNRLSIVSMTLFTACAAAFADDISALIGTYTENQPCTAGEPSQNVAVKITPTQIDSVFGLCTILETKQEGNTYAMHVECPGPGGAQMLGDVSFTIREDKAIDFSDQDQTYKAVLYKCP